MEDVAGFIRANRSEESLPLMLEVFEYTDEEGGRHGSTAKRAKSPIGLALIEAAERKTAARRMMQSQPVNGNLARAL
jgi:hypothetical protein